jgi:integrase
VRRRRATTTTKKKKNEAAKAQESPGYGEEEKTLFAHSCKGTTFERYEGAWGRMLRKTPDGKGPFSISAKGFAGYLAAWAPTTAWKWQTISVLRFAVLKYMILEGKPASKEDLDIMMTAAKGYIGMTAARSKPTPTRGVYTFQMIAQLHDLRFAVGITDTEMIAIRFQFGFCLRAADVGRVSWKYIFKGADGVSWYLQLRRLKRGKSGVVAATPKQLVETHRCIPSVVPWIETAQRLEIGTRHKDGRLFPGWTSTKINPKLHKAAELAGWDERWTFSSHALRFGGCFSVAEELRGQNKSWQEIAAAVSQFSGHLGEGMAMFYALIPEMRAGSKLPKNARGRPRVAASTSTTKSKAKPSAKNNRVAEVKKGKKALPQKSPKGKKAKK